MLLGTETGKLYEVKTISTIHTIAYVRKNTPTHAVFNYFKHGSFVRSEGQLDVPEETLEMSTQDDCVLNHILPSTVLCFS